MAGKITLKGKYAKLAQKMLIDVCTFLTDSNIPYVLEAGTLLGVIRENRLLPWDNDLDLTVTEHFCDKLLKKRWKLWLKGYRTRIRRYKIKTGPFTKGEVRIIKIQTTKFFFFKDQSLMDIFIKKPIGENYYWTVSEKKPVLKSAPCHYYDRKKTYIFLNHTFLVPEDYTGYLEYHYGKNWKIPIKTWDFRTDDKCVKEILSDGQHAQKDDSPLYSQAG